MLPQIFKILKYTAFKNFQPQYLVNKMWKTSCIKKVSLERREEEAIQMNAKTKDKWKYCSSPPINGGQWTLLFLGYYKDSLKFVMCSDRVRTAEQSSRK